MDNSVCMYERERREKGKRIWISFGNLFLGSILRIAQYNLSKSFHLSIVFSSFSPTRLPTTSFSQRLQNKSANARRNPSFINERHPLLSNGDRVNVNK